MWRRSPAPIYWRPASLSLSVVLLPAGCRGPKHCYISYSQSSEMVKTRKVLPLKSCRVVVPATDEVYSWLGLKGLNFIPVTAPPAPIYKEGDEQKKKSTE